MSNQQVLVDKSLVNDIANYLSQLPYREVAVLMMGIGKALNAPPPIQEEEKQLSEDNEEPLPRNSHGHPRPVLKE